MHQFLTPKMGVVIIAVILALFLIFSLIKVDVFWAPLAGVVTWQHYVLLALILLLITTLVRALFQTPAGEMRWQKIEREAEMRTHVVSFAIFLVFIVAGGFLAVITDDPSKRPDLFAILLTGATATIAILFQINRENKRQREERRDADHRQRRDFTHKTLQEFRTDREVQKNRANLRYEYPGQNVITEYDLARHYASQMDPASYKLEGDVSMNVPVLDSVNALLAFYEQLAADIHDDVKAGGDRGSVDEELLLNTMAPVIVNTFRKSLQDIKVKWRVGLETYEHLRWLINRWSLRAKAENRVYKADYAEENWKREIWSEEGLDNCLEHGDEDKGPWGQAALRDLALKGLKSWPADRPSERLVEKILALWGDDPDFKETVEKLQERRETTEPTAQSKQNIADEVAGLRAEVANLCKAVDRLTPDGNA